MSDEQNIIQLLNAGKNFYIVSHQLPDGDSIGSLLALGTVLADAGKEVRLCSPDPVPAKYRFLHGSEMINSSPEYNGDAVAIVIDCSDLERTGEFKKSLSRAKQLINIDHHVTNRYFGTLNLVVPDAAATGEIIYNLFVKMKMAITRPVAESLFVAITTDSGSFKYESTTPETLRVAAALLEYGLNPGEISQRVFDDRPLSYFLLLKDALSTLEIDWQNKLAVMTISRDMLLRSGALLEDIDGMVNYTRNIQGIEIGILFYIESEEEVKVAFRSRTVDVSILAGRFNGGGHSRAAGCRMRGRFEEVKDRVAAEALKVIREAGV